MSETQMTEMVLTNARLVLSDIVIDGSIQIRDGRIADIASGRSTAPGALDCDGDYVIPGLVELHTDNLERHLQPRPGVEWPRRAAVAAHDGEFISVGVSTIFDALRVGTINVDGIGHYAPAVLEAEQALNDLGLLKADHYFHLRCEVSSSKLVEEFDSVGDDPRVRLISIMDHTPGQRQFANIDKLKQYYQGKHGWSDDRMAAFVVEAKKNQARWCPPNIAALKERAEKRNFAVASHDDATEDQVAESVAVGANIAEFPTTLEAARASRSAGLKILMGAPNLLRGFSHSGNVSAMDLAREGLVDVLSSDYAPASLMLAAFKLAEETDYGLPAAIGTVTRNPALAVDLKDRGALEVGLRADLARVYRAERLCVTRGVWREGERVT
ncbi:MAG: alpha-D-ribose 1-methylphosphonate 5-triphosphate diphosphatase [Pseudomonadota bacterium]